MLPFVGIDANLEKEYTMNIVAVNASLISANEPVLVTKGTAGENFRY